jgi:hypothetical protein
MSTVQQRTRVNVASPGRYGARLITQTRRDITAAVARTAGGHGLDGPDSVRRRLIAWLDDNDTTEGFFRLMADESLEDGVRLLTVADQHAVAIEELLEIGSAFAALPTLQRGLLESVLTLCYVHDPKVAPERTILRMLARSLDMFEGSQRTSVKFPRTVMGDRKEQIESAVEGVREMFTRNGVTLAPEQKGGTPHLSLGTIRENVKFNATDAARDYLGVDAHHWDTGSGGTHSKAWFLPSISAGLTEDALSDEVELMAASVLGVLAAGKALLRAVASHTGHDTRAEQERIFRREKALVHYSSGTEFSPISLSDYEKRPAEWKPKTHELNVLRPAPRACRNTYPLIENAERGRSGPPMPRLMFSVR